MSEPEYKISGVVQLGTPNRYLDGTYVHGMLPPLVAGEITAISKFFCMRGIPPMYMWLTGTLVWTDDPKLVTCPGCLEWIHA